MFKLHMGVRLATPTHWATPTPTRPFPFPKNPNNDHFCKSEIIINERKQMWEFPGKGAWPYGGGCGPMGGSGQTHPHVKFEHKISFMIIN